MTVVRITAERLLDAILKANEEVHPAQQAYFIDDDLGDVLIDGRINLRRIAELLEDEE